MKLNSIKCSGCGAPITIDKDVDFVTCDCCNTYYAVHRTKDETKAKLLRMRMSHEEMMYEKQQKEKEEEWKRREVSERNGFIRKNIGIALLVAVLCAFLIGGVVSLIAMDANSKRASDMQEAELQIIVEEVMDDIESGDYASARIKAESIHYTNNRSSKIREKWDAKRNRILLEIDRAEKRAELQAILDEIRDCIGRGEFDIARKKAKDVKCSKQVEKSIQEEWETAKTNVLAEISVAEKQAKQDLKDAKKAEKEAKKAEKEKEKQEKAAQKEIERQEKAAQKEKEKQEKTAQKEKEKQEKTAQKEKEKQEKAAQEESGENSGILDWIKDKINQFRT